MTEEKVENSQFLKGADELNRDDIDRAARDIILIERRCFYGDELERDRLKKIREKLLNIITDK